MIESKYIPCFNLIKAYKMQLVLSDMHTLDPAHVIVSQILLALSERLCHCGMLSCFALRHRF